MKMLRAFAVSLFLLFSFHASGFAEELRVSVKDPQADYERVWSAAIDTLYEMGFPISFMSKGDGYLVTEKKEIRVVSGSKSVRGDRVRMTLRFAKADDTIVVKISSNAEHMSWSSTKELNFPPFYLWETAGSDAKLEKLVKEGISSRL